MSRNGRRNGGRRDRCPRCGRQSQSARRTGRIKDAIWRDHVWRRQTLAQVAAERGRSVGWVRARLDSRAATPKVHRPRRVVVVADVTFWGRAHGVIVFRDPDAGENLWWEEVAAETVEAYRRGRAEIERLGYEIVGAVIDGRKGVREAFAGLPAQSCQFHQVKAIGRHLTRRPKLPAARELWVLALTLTKSTEESFSPALDAWHEKWKGFIGERTTDAATGKWFYTHKRIRTAYRSLKSNLPLLFTYLNRPDLKMPNTTNSLDGSFAHLKGRVGVHRGKKSARRYAIICEILNGSSSRFCH
jgi:hypothetical protein